MAVTSDIMESWRRPRAVFRRHLARGRSEAFAFSLLCVFLLIALISRYPAAARVSALDPKVPVPPQILGTALGLLAAIPLLYTLAALSHLVARTFGGRGGWYGARMALFWALVTVTPFLLLSGIVAGLIGPGPQLWCAGGLTFAAFLFQWLTTLMVAETGMS
ncbi:MAG: YIP1 family protein [Gemmobacter sp.]|jgi:hypothetical protein|nr:YIP1 family protein [Gemmobacter sp.]